MENKRKSKKTFLQQVEIVLEKFGQILCDAGSFLWVRFKDVKRLRKVLLAIPVAVAAVWLALYTSNKLPDMVGINLLETGEYSQMIAKEVAVMGPLAVTALCLLLMFCSKRTLYPWLISIFSLALPLLLLVTNIFPA